MPLPPVFPHFCLSRTNRFNYASLDCSARMYAAPHAAKSSKQDQCVISPRDAARPKFVVVELCQQFHRRGLPVL